MLVALGSLASAQSKGTEDTLEAAIQLLNYAATLPGATIRFHSSDMILHIHTDASYLSEPEAKSRVAGFFFLSTAPTPQPVPINGPVHIVSQILRTVVASAAEAEVAATFVSGQDGSHIRNILHFLGHQQPPTLIQTNNSVAKGIIDNTVKQKRSKAIDMRYYWIRDRVTQNEFTIHWKPGIVNLADYHSKHFSPTHHQYHRPIYLHEPTSTEACVKFLEQKPD
jgi:hypothetical protein